MEEEPLKECSKCGELKTYSEYYKSKTHRCGYHGQCKKCTKLQTKRYRDSHKIELRESKREYYKNNKESLSIKHREYYEDNWNGINKRQSEYQKMNRAKINIRNKKNRDADIELYRTKERKYRSKNRESINAAAKIWRDNNPQVMKEKRSESALYNIEYGKKYRANNKSKHAEYKKEYHQKRKNEKEYIIKRLLRVRVKMALKKGAVARSGSYHDLLGCVPMHAAKYLESLFIEGMTWENHGEWHIDHIIPCASFDLIDPEQQKKCFHYSNLQPLWAKDNLSKGSKCP